MISSQYNPNPIIIHAGFLKRKNFFYFFIWGEQKKHKKYIDIEPFKYPFLYSPFELKLALFRNHCQSFYGTFLEISESQIEVPLDNRLFHSLAGNVPVYHVPSTHDKHLFPINGIEIPFQDIQTYIAGILQITANSEWELSDDFIFAQSLFKVLLEELIIGNFLPSKNGKWCLSEFDYQKWEDSMPTSLLALHPQSSSLIDKRRENISLKMICEAFIHSYVSSMINTNNDVYSAFQNLQNNEVKTTTKIISNMVNNQPINQTQEEYQRFLENIGAVEVAPFKLGIRVEEAKQDNNWRLTLFIQDKADHSLIMNVSELVLGNHPWRDNPITFIKETLHVLQGKIKDFPPLSLTSPSITVNIEDAFRLFEEQKEIFMQLGITVFVPSWWSKKEAQFSVTLKQNEAGNTNSFVEPLLNWRGIAEFDYSISVAGVTISEAEFHELVNLKQSIVSHRGKWIVWDHTLAEQVQNRIQLYKNKKKLTYIDAFVLSQNEEAEKNIQWTAIWNQKLSSLLEELTMHQWKKIAIPGSLNGSLRPYQQDGYSWLLNMRRIGFGACLADDMGLGKTIQTITYLLAVQEAIPKDQKRPFLLICPTSLIGNWEYELQQFAPTLKVFVHHGQQRLDEETFAQSTKDVDVIITSYALAVRDEDLWVSQLWQGLILDEAQHIKNIETKQRKSIKKINAAHYIALTGTPIENRLKELWSIIDLLNDHFLGTYHQFYHAYVKDIEGQNDSKEKVIELRKLISPFLLRRTKQDKNIHLQLPNKTEIIHRVGLTMEQASLYQAVINQLFLRVNHVSEMERRALILSSLTKLKQICNHPVQYMKDAGILNDRSEKWEELILLAETIHSNEEKALIFTQYKEMGMIIQRGLEEHFTTQIPFLHGSLQRQKREELIREFQGGKAPFFILSLKAGGVGLNLTKATHVIHYDRWWNPAVENQATDRAYRIGQSEDVTVHKLVTKGTLEEKIHKMLEQKQQLSDEVLNTTETRLSELTTDELEQFLSLRINSFT